MNKWLDNRKCTNCINNAEIAGGADHGDYRCVKENGPIYFKRPHQLEQSDADLVEKCDYRTGTKTAVITGASRGIGRAIAERFALEGYDLALLSRHKEDVEKVAQEISERSMKTMHVPYECDIRDSAQVRDTFCKIMRKFGSINVLVNNAGINSRKVLNKNSLDSWFDDFQENLAGFQDEIATNLTGAYSCSYFAAGQMLKQTSGGVIINISSIKGKEATSSPGYGASKAGIIKLTRDFAKTLAPQIRVNCIAPGFIDTGMTTELPEDKKKEYRKMIPQARFGTVEEVAKLVSFLASKDSAYITGACIDINGGYLMS